MLELSVCCPRGVDVAQELHGALGFITHSIIDQLSVSPNSLQPAPGRASSGEFEKQSFK